MRKALVWLFLVLLTAGLLCGSAAAQSQTSFLMAGFDTEASGHDWDNNLFFRRREQQSGIVFGFRQFHDAREYKLFLEQLVRGEESVDVLFKASLTRQEIQHLYQQGLLIDLAPYLSSDMPQLSALLDEHPEWRTAITLPDGSIPALPQLNQLLTNNAIWINTRWLRALQLDVPTTAEELTQVLRAMRSSDPNRNGKQDEIPLEFTGLWDLRYLGHAFGLVADDYYLYTGEDGQVKSILVSEQNRAFLEWLRLLWNERLMDRNGFSTADASRKISDNNAAVTYGIVMGPSALNMISSNASQDYELLMPLKYEGQQKYRSLMGDLVTGTFAVTNSCKDVHTVLQWVDYLYGEEGMFLAYAGLEGEEYTRASDGKWFWNDDPQTVTNLVLTEDTIGEGASIPGLVTAEYQLSYDDAQTAKVVQELKDLSELSVLPVPILYLSEEQAAEIDSFWPALSEYAETTMTWFVTGDMELNDENWSSFCKRVEELGLSRLITVYQTALDLQHGGEAAQ